MDKVTRRKLKRETNLLLIWPIGVKKLWSSVNEPRLY